MHETPIPPLQCLSTGAQPALEFVRSQFEKCKDNHVGCRQYESGKVCAPARLLDVGHSTNEYVYLRDATKFTRTAYTCLSYCWGYRQKLKLTKDTESAFKAGLLTKELPQTYQDAIRITRLLGVRYLWIDAL